MGEGRVGEEGEGLDLTGLDRAVRIQYIHTHAHMIKQVTWNVSSVILSFDHNNVHTVQYVRTDFQHTWICGGDYGQYYLPRISLGHSPILILLYDQLVSRWMGAGGLKLVAY